MKSWSLLVLCAGLVSATTARTNYALGKRAVQTGIDWEGEASRAVDGNPNGDYGEGHCSHTDERDKPYWYVDLGQEHHVTSVRIANRVDCCADRLNNYDIVVTNAEPAGPTPIYENSNICYHGSRHRQGMFELDCIRPVTGRYVMIRLMYRGMLTLCEVEVYGEPNLALGKTTYQTGIGWNGYSYKAVDGNPNGYYHDGYCTHTDERNAPHWFVDLGRQYKVTGLLISNRLDCCGDRLKNYDVVVTDSAPTGDSPTYTQAEVCTHEATSRPGTFYLACKREVRGRYVMIRLLYRTMLTLCEVEVFGVEDEANESDRPLQVFVGV